MSNQVPTLIQQLLDRGERLAFAESCTGGLLSALWTKWPGVSKVFDGAAVVYANSAKTKLLGVKDSSLHEHGAVSEKVALEMAVGVSRSFDTDWGVAVTGIAGPDGGTPAKPVGTVCFGLRGPDLEATWTRHFTGDREQVQKAAAAFANECLAEALGGRLKKTK